MVVESVIQRHPGRRRSSDCLMILEVVEVILKRNVLSVALSSALLAVYASAHAQQTEEAQQAADAAANEAAQADEKEDAAQLDNVVVTGFRRSIESSISTKLMETSIVEVISAEDIGKLPDISIAESIARLPGLTAQRVAGRSSTISIRGLAGDFSTTLLNGREQVSSGDNRGVEFDQYPAELLSSVVVYKTPDARLVAQGISGTVDLRTVRPLSVAERTLVVNGRLEDNSQGKLNPDSDDRGNRFSLSYIDKFANDTIGVALGFARLDSPGQANRWNAWGYANAAAAGQPFIAGIGGTESFATSTDNVRNGFMGVFEFKPNDNYTGTLDLYYSKFKRDETTRGLQAGLGFSGASLDPRVTPVIVDRVLLSGRALDAYGPVLRNDLNERDDDIFAIGFKNEFQFNDQWKGIADLSMSRANRDESILETYSGIPINSTSRDFVDFTFNPESGLPTLTWGRNYNDPGVVRLGDPGGWGQNGYVKFPKFKDELRSAFLSAERQLGNNLFSSVEFGGNYSRREKSREVAEAFLDLIGGPNIAIPSNLLRGSANLGFTGIPGIVAYDVAGAYASLYRPRTNVNQDILNKDWNVEETVLLGFGKLNIDTMLGSVPVRGNLGLQYVKADQESEGFAVPGGNANAAQPFKGGADYGDILPSLNVSFDFANDSVLRFGAARQQARPRMDQMRANNGFGINQTLRRWEGSGGNPELKPWDANSYDLSFEKYFGGTKGYFSAAAFHKDLKTFIYDQGVDFDFSVFNLSGFTGALPPTTIGRFTRPTNGSGGTINGFEYAFSAPFDLLFPNLEGFGLQGSYSDTRSAVRPNGPGTTQPLPGLSRFVSNITAYYENHGFSTRISQRTRSSFIGEIQGFGADRETRFIKGEKIIDFQVGYEFSQPMLEGMSVLLQVYNLNDEPYVELIEVGELGRTLTRSYNEYGRTVLFGVNYKF
jgi:iron complex outermembrane recepter protein